MRATLTQQYTNLPTVWQEQTDCLFDISALQIDGSPAIVDKAGVKTALRAVGYAKEDLVHHRVEEWFVNRQHTHLHTYIHPFAQDEAVWRRAVCQSCFVSVVFERPFQRPFDV
eukprot:Lankesteria_metandrocarpae@DN8789_c0_g1_i1.p1